MELSKEYFDQRLESLATKPDIAGVRGHLDEVEVALRELDRGYNSDLLMLLRDMADIKRSLRAYQQHSHQ